MPPRRKKSILNPDGTYVKLIKEKKEHNSPPSGDQYGTCEICGKRFEQYLMESRNCYSSFRKCPEHRKAGRKKKSTDDPLQEVLGIQLDYVPHEKQALFHSSEARFRVLNCGSRFGKDRATNMEAIKYFCECLNEDRPTDMIPSVYWWIVAPTEKMAKQNWNELKRYFPKDLVVDVSNSTMSLQTVYGGLIEVRSAYDPESLVGVGLDIVTITEAARISDMDVVWANLEQRLNSPGRGKNGKGGIGIINSSPKGRNYFYKMWTWGQRNHADYDPDWESWTFSTWDNPAMAEKGDEIKINKFGVPLTYRERLRKRLGDRRYRQDIMAEFLAGQTNCFPQFEENCVVRMPASLSRKEKQEFIQNWQEPVVGYTYTIGYDPASVNDIPAVVVLEDQTDNIKKICNMTGYSWTRQYDHLTDLAAYYNDASIAFGRTGHETINEELVKRGNTTIPLNEQGQNKQNYVNHLESRVENSRLHVLYDETDESEMLVLQFCDYSATEKGNNTVYGNVEQPHDDFVSATYFACQGNKEPEDALPYIGMLSSIKL
ncbi:MAG: hypothetical protein UGF45_09935 [Massilioclostridium sp.]|nr:hypothetical protein [Massilioclostridium sp.]